MNDNEKIPAIPPSDYTGTISNWMTTLIKFGLWDGKGWHGDVEITVEDSIKVLKECESW